MLANILRTDRHLHRSPPVISEQALAIKALARQHQEAIWAMNQTISRLRSVLLEFYPQAIKALLHRCGRRNDTRLVDQILADLKTPALRQSERVEAPLGLTVDGLVHIVTAMRHSVEQLAAELAREFETHPLAPVLCSAPGLGPSRSSSSPPRPGCTSTNSDCTHRLPTPHQPSTKQAYYRENTPRQQTLSGLLTV